MAFDVVASLMIPVSAEIAFNRLLDYPSWKEWMPTSFRPASVGRDSLREGTKIRVRLLNLPVAVPIRITVVRKSTEVAWGGGVARLFLADHHFYFEPKGDAEVLVRSVERWSGVFAMLAQRRIARDAQRVGEEQLAALAGSLKSNPPPGRVG